MADNISVTSALVMALANMAGARTSRTPWVASVLILKPLQLMETADAVCSPGTPLSNVVLIPLPEFSKFLVLVKTVVPRLMARGSRPVIRRMAKRLRRCRSKLLGKVPQRTMDGPTSSLTYRQGDYSSSKHDEGKSKNVRRPSYYSVRKGP